MRFMSTSLLDTGHYIVFFEVSEVTYKISWLYITERTYERT